MNNTFEPPDDVFTFITYKLAQSMFLQVEKLIRSHTLTTAEIGNKKLDWQTISRMSITYAQALLKNKQHYKTHQDVAIFFFLLSELKFQNFCRIFRDSDGCE